MDLLQELYYGEVTIDEAYDKYDRIQGEIEKGKYTENMINNTIEMGTIMGMNNYEYTALCQGAPLNIIANWRYKGWPDKCCISNRKFNYQNYNWLVVELENEEYGLEYIGK